VGVGRHQLLAGAESAIDGSVRRRVADLRARLGDAAGLRFRSGRRRGTGRQSRVLRPRLPMALRTRHGGALPASPPAPQLPGAGQGGARAQLLLPVASVARTVDWGRAAGRGPGGPMSGGGGWLDFERPILEIEAKIRELRELATSKGMDAGRELESLERQAERLRDEVYSNLTPWQRVQLARHPRRPYTLDYIGAICEEFTELHGDRQFGDDRAIVGGMALLGGRQVLVVGHQKGRDVKENLARNFGMPHPEGYRKALRLMQLAGKFGRPIVTLVDTPGAFPGVDAEKRGQSEAIARNLREMVRIPVPIVVVIIGEGGSGGALALAVRDRVLRFENSIYSVISPEGCAAILWGDRA